MPWCIVYFCLLLFCAYKTARHRHQQVILLVACNLVTFLSTAIARCVLHQFEHWERWRREVTTLSLLLLDISKSGWLPGPSRGPSIHKESYILRMKVVCCLWCVFLSDWDTLPSFQTALAYLTYYIYIVTQTHPLTCAFYCIQLVLIHSCQMGLVKKFEANKHRQKDCLTTCDSNKISTISVNIHTVPQKSTKIPKVKTNCGDSRMFSYLQSTFLWLHSGAA